VAKPTTQNLTSAQIERKRVDDFIQARLLEQRIAHTQQAQKFDYPVPVALMGQGFRNLYDTLRGEQNRFTKGVKK
jgi:ERCC4-type nuclease